MYGPVDLEGMPAGITIVPSKSPVSPLADACWDEGLVVATGTWPAQNRALFMPFEICDAITVTKIGWFNSSTVNGSIDVGIYDHDGKALSTLGGVLMSGASAFQIGDLADVTLEYGHYYLAMSSNSLTANFLRTALVAITMQAAGCQEMASAYPLPAVATFANPSSAYQPFVWLSSSSIGV